jgi:hypothetical protein
MSGKAEQSVVVEQDDSVDELTGEMATPEFDQDPYPLVISSLRMS